MPTGRRPASRSGSRGGDHVAAGGDDDARPCGVALGAGLPPTTWWSSTAWSSGIGMLLLGLEANRRVDLLLVLDQRQPQGAHDDALVGDAEPDLLAELVLREERLEASARASGSGTSPSRTTPGSSGSIAVRLTSSGAVAAHLGRGDAAGLDVEADDGAWLLRADIVASACLGLRRFHRPSGRHGLSAGTDPVLGVRRLSANEGVQVPVEQLVARRAGRPRRRAPGRGRRGSPACARPRRGGASARRRRARRRARATSIAGATARPRKRPITAASLTSPIPIPRG